jgi:hypothetical protein
MMARPPAAGFVPLKALGKGPPDAREALAEIRRIYFATGRETIEHDLTHAIELLKAIPAEEDREKASVYMEGLNEMRREWEGQRRRRARAGRGAMKARGRKGTQD